MQAQSHHQKRRARRRKSRKALLSRVDGKWLDDLMLGKGLEAPLFCRVGKAAGTLKLGPYAIKRKVGMMEDSVLRGRPRYKVQELKHMVTLGELYIHMFM